MARIAGVTIPNNKCIRISLTYIYGIGRSSAKKILDELHFPISSDDIIWLLRSVTALDLIEDPFNIPGSVFERLFLTERSEDLFSLMTLTEHVAEKKRSSIQERISDIRTRLGDDIQPLVSGSDLQEAGYTPGPKFRTILNKIRDLQIEKPLN